MADITIFPALPSPHNLAALGLARQLTHAIPVRGQHRQSLSAGHGPHTLHAGRERRRPSAVFHRSAYIKPDPRALKQRRRPQIAGADGAHSKKEPRRRRLPVVTNARLRHPRLGAPTAGAEQLAQPRQLHPGHPGHPVKWHAQCQHHQPAARAHAPPVVTLQTAVVDKQRLVFVAVANTLHGFGALSLDCNVLFLGCFNLLHCLGKLHHLVCLFLHHQHALGNAHRSQSSHRRLCLFFGFCDHHAPDVCHILTALPAVRHAPVRPILQQPGRALNVFRFGAFYAHIHALTEPEHLQPGNHSRLSRCRGSSSGG